MPTRGDPERDADELDEELDLPPSDDDDDEGAAGDPTDDLLDGIEDEGLDDTDADDLDVGGDDLDEDDSVDDDDREIDVGALDEGIDDDDERTTDVEPDGVGDDESDIDHDSPSDDDGGAEGTSEDPGDEVDEHAFPDLDDDANEGREDGLAEELIAETEPAAPIWVPLEGAGAPLPCCATSVLGGRVAAAGEVLLLVEEGARAARSLPFGEASVAVAIGEDAVLAATARGQLQLAKDGGADVLSLGSWRAGVGASMGLWPADSAPAVELCATPGRFWIRAGAALLCFRSVQAKLDRASAKSPARPVTMGEPPAAVRERGVLAITASRGVLVALAVGPQGPAIERFRGDDEGWAATPLEGEAQRIAERDRGALRLAAAAGGRSVALTDQRRIALSRDGGETFAIFDLGNVSAITFQGDEPDAPLLALLTPPTATTLAEIAEIQHEEAIEVGESRSPRSEAPTPEAPSQRAPTASLTWDASRDVVWIACAAGLFALGRPQRH